MKVNLRDDIVGEDEKKKLKDLLGISDEMEYQEALQGIVCAALSEYKEMMLGMGTPSRADEIRQYRLYHLIKEYCKGEIPSELQVARMFQLTQTRARTLIRSVITRFHFDLEQEKLNALRDVVINATKNDESDKGGDYTSVIQSKYIVEELDNIICDLNSTCDSVKKVPNKTNLYTISMDAYALLCSELDVELGGEK